MKKIMVGFIVFSLTGFVFAKAPSMPKQFQGIWDEDIANCTPKGAPRSETSTWIYSDGFARYESQCKLMSIVKTTAHSMTGKFVCESDDGDFKEADTFKLSARGRLSGLEVDQELVKCL